MATISRVEVESAAAILLCFVVALTAPDLDRLLGLGHRSALTHSVLASGLACLFARTRAAACGLAGGTATHLSADCFPNAMTGYATVKLPLAGALGAGTSYVWLAANAGLALLLFLLLLRRLHAPVAALAIAAAAGTAALFYLYRTDGGWPVLALIALAGAALLRRRHLRRVR